MYHTLVRVHNVTIVMAMGLQHSAVCHLMGLVTSKFTVDDVYLISENLVL